MNARIGVIPSIQRKEKLLIYMELNNNLIVKVEGLSELQSHLVALC